MAVDHDRAAAAVRELLIAVGEDPDREGLRDTPDRVARAYAELEAGGLLDSSRTRGTRVRPGQQADPEVRRAVELFVAAARLTSTELADVLGLVRTEWNRQS